MRELREQLLDIRFWQITYDKFMLKSGLSDADICTISDCFYLNREKIIDELLNGVYSWSIPQKVEIAKDGTKKKRVVYVYSIKDRFVLGVLYRSFSNYYSDRMSPACFSYKTGVSTNDAIIYLKDKIEGQSKKGVKIDIHSYFNSVSEEKVHQMVDELFFDGMKTSIENLMFNNVVWYKGKKIEEWKSLIPGCAFGSLFANYCLRECDAYFVDRNKIYARYSDDIIVLEDTDEELQEDLDVIRGYLDQYGLEINPKKYTWFEENDAFEYLGLKLCGDGKVDISDHAKKKIKAQIHRWCRKGRMSIERNGLDFEKVAKSIIRKFNTKNMFCIIDNEAKFGWCHYAFRYLTTIESLREIDFYMRDTLRAMKTGKHNKANINALSDDDFKRLGWVSLVDMYILYKQDFDYYIEIVELLKNT